MFEIFVRARLMKEKVIETNNNLKQLYKDIMDSGDDKLIEGIKNVIYTYNGIVTRIDTLNPLDKNLLDTELQQISLTFHYELENKEGI